MGNVDLAPAEGPTFAAARNRGLPASAAFGWLRAGWRDLTAAAGFQPCLRPRRVRRFRRDRRRASLPRPRLHPVSRHRGLHGRRPACRRRALRKEPPDRGRQAGVAPAHDLRQAGLRRAGPVHRRHHAGPGAAVDARGRHSLRAVLRAAALPGPRPTRPNAVHDGHRMGDARHGHRRRRRVRGVFLRDQRLLRADAPRRADRRLHGDGHEHSRWSGTTGR